MCCVCVIRLCVCSLTLNAGEFLGKVYAVSVLWMYECMLVFLKMRVCKCVVCGALYALRMVVKRVCACARVRVLCVCVCVVCVLCVWLVMCVNFIYVLAFKYITSKSGFPLRGRRQRSSSCVDSDRHACEGSRDHRCWEGSLEAHYHPPLLRGIINVVKLLRSSLSKHLQVFIKENVDDQDTESQGKRKNS